MPLKIVENMLQWGGSIVQAAAAAFDGNTGLQPLVRSTARRFSQILTTTPLPANGVFNSPWFDTNQTGDYFAVVTARSDQASAVTGFLVQETDDISDANFLFNIAVGASNAFGVGTSLVANTTTPIYGLIRRRYWRVQFTNGATPQGTLKIAVSSSDKIFPQQLNGGGGVVGTGALPVNIATGNAGSLPSDNSGPGAPFSISSMNYATTSSTAAGWFALRTPNVFKTASVAATPTGNTAVWTPTAGKKFRLMRFQITAQGLAATATGVVTVSFQDSASGITIGTYDVDVPAVAGVVSGVTNISGGWVDLGNGFLSAAANNVLNFNIGAAGAGTVGTYRVNVCGTEE